MDSPLVVLRKGDGQIRGAFQLGWVLAFQEDGGSDNSLIYC